MLNMWDPKVTDPTGDAEHLLSHDLMVFAMQPTATQPTGTAPGSSTEIMTVAR